MKSNFKIKFINHASLLIDDGTNKFLTDPWYISPAFEGWVQNPMPSYNDIKDIVINREKINLIISHGHDDHLDDYFIKNYLNDTQIIISDFESKGFYRRVSNLSNKLPLEIKQGINNSYENNNINIYSFINKFAGADNDSILIICNNEEVIIHANDNYRVQPDEIVEQIKLISKNKFIYYFSQAGIASSFPINFSHYSDSEKKTIIHEENKRFIESFERNIERIKPDLAFTYANQARFNFHHIVPYDDLIEQINKNSFIKQLYPGDIILNQILERNTNKQDSINTVLLKKAEKLTNNYIKSKMNSEFKISFFIKDINVKLQPIKNNIFFVADTFTWSNILTGKQNLESILIGGLGEVIKLHEDNMREEAQLIGEFAYIFQNRETKKFF
mgnify:CR=1 FL=1|tara:strand:+ start:624 stop:1787 length:1164 start_codon:yes stop_codon:yes gene_type:complete